MDPAGAARGALRRAPVRRFCPRIEVRPRRAQRPAEDADRCRHPETGRISGKRPARPRRISPRRQGPRSLHDHLCALAMGRPVMPPPDGPAAKVTDRGSGRPVKVVLTSEPKAKALTMRDLKIAPGPGAK